MKIGDRAVGTQDEVYGEYRVLGQLGHGAMGIVHRAHDPRLDRYVALKLVLPFGGARDATKARARLVAEARALARVSHPNVLAVYDVGVRRDVVYVALELVDGVDLDQWLRARARPWTEVVRVFDAVAAGLCAVHDAGLVHRDVKPANVLIERAVPGRAAERVLVADFGVARATSGVESITEPGDAEVSGSGDQPLTETGRVVGTPVYMAPEQHYGLEAGPAADQYAYCVAFHEALYGKRPFGGDIWSLLHAKQSPPDAPPASSDVPRWLWRIVRRGLSLNPADRFASMADLRAALRDGPRRRRRLLVLGAGATILAGIAIAWAVTRGDRCDVYAARLGEVWNDGRAASIAAAFVASDRPGARETWKRVAPRFDDYARDLEAMYRDACEATYVRAEQSEEVFDRRVACLDRRRHGLAQSLALLERGDADVVARADDVASSLRTLDACNDVLALESDVEPPSPSQREAVARVDRVVADAEALQAAGRYADAASSADAAVALARVVDYPPALVDALTVAAEIHERLSEVDQARALLDEAISAGTEVGADSVVLRAVVLRTWIAAEYERDLAGAERFGALGRALSKRVGDPLVPAVGLHNSLGTAYVTAGRTADGLREFEAALERVQEDPELAAWTATLLGNIGGARYRLGELERASESYERAREIFRGLHGEDHPVVVNASIRVAQLQEQRGLRQEAIAGLRDAIAALERMQATPTELGTALISLGIALRNVGADDEANTTYRRAVELLDATGDAVTLAHALVGYGNSCVDKSIYDAAETQFQRAIVLLEPLDAASPDLVNARLGLGRIREQQSKPAEAMSFYRRALDGARPGTRDEARALVAIARVHRSTGRYDDAIAALDRQDAVLAKAPLVLLDDRVAAATARVDVLVDAGRAGESVAPIDALERLLAEVREAGGSRRAIEGERTLARARLARGAEAGLDSSTAR